MTYTYGYGVVASVLTEYATKVVALRVLEVKAAVSAVGVDLKAGPWSALYASLKQRTVEMEAYFNSVQLGVLSAPIALL
jgi:hypothetical protein